MDLSNPAALFSGLIISAIGAGFLLYGKKQSAPIPVIGGLVLCVMPMMVASVLAMWLIGGACVGGMWWVSKQA